MKMIFAILVLSCAALGQASPKSLSNSALADLARSTAKKLEAGSHRHCVRKADMIGESYASALDKAAPDEHDKLITEMQGKIAASLAQCEQVEMGVIIVADAVRLEILRRLGNPHLRANAKNGIDDYKHDVFTKGQTRRAFNFDAESSSAYLEQLADRLP